MIPQVMFFVVVFFVFVAYSYSAGLHRNEKIGRGFGINVGEWTGRVEISEKKFLAVSVTCMAIN